MEKRVFTQKNRRYEKKGRQSVPKTTEFHAVFSQFTKNICAVPSANSNSFVISKSYLITWGFSADIKLHGQQRLFNHVSSPLMELKNLVFGVVDDEERGCSVMVFGESDCGRVFWQIDINNDPTHLQQQKRTTVWRGFPIRSGKQLLKAKKMTTQHRPHACVYSQSCPEAAIGSSPVAWSQ